jgi:outer membrane lipoprotein-sorting protein
MKASHIIVAVVLALTVAAALCLVGCGREQAATTEEPGAPAGPATSEQPVTEEPGEATGGGGVGDKLAQLLGSVSPPTSYEMKVISPSGQEGPGGTVLMKMAEDKPVKMKSISDKRWAIFDYDAKVMYTYDPDQDVVRKMSLDQITPPASRDPSKRVDPEAVTIGSERVDDVDCWVISSTVEGTTGKVWVGKQDGLPRQAEAEGGVIKYQYSRMNEVPNSEFELPPGVEVKEMPQMPRMPQR